MDCNLPLFNRQPQCQLRDHAFSWSDNCFTPAREISTYSGAGWPREKSLGLMSRVSLRKGQLMGRRVCATFRITCEMIW